MYGFVECLFFLEKINKKHSYIWIYFWNFYLDSTKIDLALTYKINIYVVIKAKDVFEKKLSF